jgi:DhnA family fructose-bisphosphate aldolase class Ia|tara:strand:- start:41 stop:823 length:783 start_codon:yes stop_codon:yes gene_type:complete
MDRASNLSKFLQSDGRTVILPIDHGSVIPVAEMNPLQIIEDLNPAVDGFVVNLGVAKAATDLFGDKGVCLRTDCYKPVYGENVDEGSYRLYGADEALNTGAHAMMNMLYSNHPNEADNAREVAELISESLETDIPVILEALPFSIGRPDDYTVENISFTVRAAAELGADIVKTAYPTQGTVDDFRAIVESCFVPVVVLGGSAMDDDAALLAMVKNAMDAGAIGTAVGRNIFQHSQPSKIAAAISAIVHEEASVDSALKLL